MAMLYTDCNKDVTLTKKGLKIDVTTSQTGVLFCIK